MQGIYRDIPRLYTAIAEWGACVVQITVLNRRLRGWRLFAALSAALLLQASFLMFTDHLPTVLWIPCMAAATGLMLLYLFLCCREKFVTAAAACARAFLLAEFAASLEWQLHCYILMRLGSLPRPIQWGMAALTYSVIFFAGYRLEKVIHRGEAGGQESLSEISVVIIVCVLAFLLSNLSFVVSSSPFSGNIIQDIFYIRTLVDLGGIAILYAYQGHMREVHVRRELTHINTLFRNQYHYYRNYQESVDLVNIRYHDLKHQIDALRNMKDADERNEWLGAMEKEIEQYHISIHTGNAVLDTILAGKMLLCKKHDIKMTCVADGKLLSFLHVTDICSIFGNALDNAIENVTDIPDREKRLIHISVSSKKGFTYIRIENYTEKPLKLKADGRTPETTKADRENHGYGLKSIGRSVEKYGGNYTFGLEKGWFVLQILFENQRFV